MSLRHTLAGVSGAVFVSGILLLATPVSGADYTAAGDGTLEITFSIPVTPEPPAPEPEPEPEPTPPQPEKPFDWNWTYAAPTCDGVTIAFPSNLPASQQGVMEIGVVGGSTSGMLYKLEGQAYQLKYPSGHAGKTVFVPWSEFRNSKIPETGTWTVTRLKVHGTNYHWEGNLVCGNTARSLPIPEVAPEPQDVPEVAPPVVPEAPESVVAPEVTPPPAPAPEPPAPPVVPAPAPLPEPVEVVQPPVQTSEPPAGEPEALAATEPTLEEGVTLE